MSENPDQQPADAPVWGVPADDEADQSTTLAPRGWDGLDAATGTAPDGSPAPDSTPSWGVVNDPGQSAPEAPAPEQAGPEQSFPDQTVPEQPAVDPFGQSAAPAQPFPTEQTSAPSFDQAPAQHYDQPAQHYDQPAQQPDQAPGPYGQPSAPGFDQQSQAQQPPAQQFGQAPGPYGQPSAPGFDQQPSAQQPQPPYGQESAPQFGGPPPAQPPGQEQFHQQYPQQPIQGQSAPQNFNEPQGYGANIGQQPGQYAQPGQPYAQPGQPYAQPGQMQMPQYTVGQPPPGAEPQVGMGPTVAGQQPMTPDDEKLWGMLSHVGTILLHFIAPLIVYLMYKDRSAFVKEQARRSLNWMIVAVGYSFALSIVVGILAFVGIGFLLTPLYWLPMVFAVIAGVKAHKGELYKYPIDLNLVK